MATDDANAVHVIVAEHKLAIRRYLERLCTETGLATPEAAAWQLFLIGEGLAVSAQVCGIDEKLAQQARAMAATLLPR
ncbi:MAG: hypothetical protein HYZ18_07740 [Pseudogulbenkiania sp.]|nr:hypothetical protein [Pseudogulbenkiania sp.]